MSRPIRSTFGNKKFWPSIFWAGLWCRITALTQSALTTLVEPVRDYGVLDQQFERDDLEGGLVGGFEDDGAGGSGLLDLEPAGGADTPAVAGSEAGESVLRHGCAEIVAKGLGDAEELFIDDAADGVDTEVVGACVATVVAVEAGRRILRLAAADVERLAEDVATAGFDGFGDRHVGFYQYLPLVSGLETAQDVLEAVGGPVEFFLL